MAAEIKKEIQLEIAHVAAATAASTSSAMVASAKNAGLNRLKISSAQPSSIRKILAFSNKSPTAIIFCVVTLIKSARWTARSRLPPKNQYCALRVRKSSLIGMPTRARCCPQ
jgi:hypothetical protein